MVRVFLGGVVAAVVVFLYLMASWTLLDFHRGTIRPLPDGWRSLVAEENRNVHSGVYAWPGPVERDVTATEDERHRRWEEMMTGHRLGPLVTVFYRRAGAEPLDPMQLAGGFVVDLLAAWIAATILHLGRSAFHSYAHRVLVVTLLGAFTAVVAHGGYFVWMWFDWNFTLVMACDVVVSWLLAGMVLAAIVKELPIDTTDRRPLLRPPGVEFGRR